MSTKTGTYLPAILGGGGDGGALFMQMSGRFQGPVQIGPLSRVMQYPDQTSQRVCCGDRSS